jgi:hypothetical protein
MMESGCVAPRPRHGPGTPCGRRTEANLRVCTACVHRVRGVLADLPRVYRSCEAALARLPQQGNSDRVSGSRTHGLPINEHAMTARTELLEVLASWAALVADEFRQRRPRSRSIEELSLFLSRRLPLLLGHPAADDFTAELYTVALAARRAAHGDPTGHREVGRCTHAGCESTVTVRLSAGDPAPQHVRCEAGHTWPPQQWLRLASQLRAAQTGSLRNRARSG